MSTDLTLSVVVCTRNRNDYLRVALDSLERQDLPADRFKVVVVDNGSSDATKSVATVALRRFVHAKYVFEAVPGHCRARNVGWQCASGQFIAYLDDDAVASPGWLTAMVQDFEHGAPGVACVGGPVSLVWERRRPIWLGDEIGTYLASAWRGDTPHVVGDGQWLLGCNFACRRTALEEIGGFDERIGRKGRNLMAMDENLLQHHLFHRHHDLLYDPRILVWHHVAAERISQPWFLRRFYWEGRSRVVYDSLTRPQYLHGWRWWRRLARILVNGWTLNWRAPGVLWRSHVDAALPFLIKCRIFEHLGYLHGLVLQALTAPSSGRA